MKVSEYSGGNAGGKKSGRPNSQDSGGSMVPFEKYIAEIQKRDQKIAELEDINRKLTQKLKEEEKKLTEALFAKTQSQPMLSPDPLSSIVIVPGMQGSGSKEPELEQLRALISKKDEELTFLKQENQELNRKYQKYFQYAKKFISKKGPDQSKEISHMTE